MNVLVIPEDFTYDQHILKPLIIAMMAHLGKPKAKVRVCQEPRLGGITQATDPDRLEDIIDNNGMVDLFLLCVDRDSKEGRRETLNNLENHSQLLGILTDKQRFFAENAWQEIEVWAIAGQKTLPKEWDWQTIRRERDPKEAYFFPLASNQDTAHKILGKQAGTNYKRVKQLCPEVQELEEKVTNWLAQLT